MAREQGSQSQAVEELECAQPIERWHSHAPIFHDLDQCAAGRHDDERPELPIIDQAKRKLDPWLSHSGDKNPRAEAPGEIVIGIPHIRWRC